MSDNEYKLNFITERIQFTPIGTKSPTRASRSNFAFPSTPFSASLGDEKTGAIIGFDHNLIQFSSYVNESFIFARGYVPEGQEHPLRSFLAQAQADNHQNYFGWGLHLQQSSGYGTKQSVRTAIERGFIDNRWPTQTDVIDGITKKAITYIKNGTLIQAAAIGSRTETSIDWRIGGLVQLGTRDSGKYMFKNLFGKNHSIKTSQGGHILSVTCHLNHCLDIQLFNNGLPLSLDAQDPNQQRGVHQDHTTDFVDIRRSGRVDLEGILKPRIFIAAFTLRDKIESPDPTYFDCPKWDEIRDRMLLPGSFETLPPPIMDLEKNEKMESFSKMEDIITRNVMQLLSTAILPSRPQPEAFNVCLTNGFVESSKTIIDYAQIFWHIRLLKLFSTQTSEISSEISEAITGTIRNLFVKKTTSLDNREQAYRTLTLFYTLRDKDNPWTPEALSKIFGDGILGEPGEDAYAQIMSEFQPDVRNFVDLDDPVECLLVWYHRWVALPEKTQGTLMELEQIWNGALDTSKLVNTSYWGFSGELWNQLALLAVELLGSREENAFGNIPAAEKLINHVAARVKKQKYRITEDLSSSGYRCLDHSQRIDLVIASSKLGKPDSRILETLQDAYFDCLYFLRSDHSFLRTWDSSDPDWLWYRWSLECSSIVCSSFLSIAGFDWSTIATDSPRRDSIQGWTAANVEEVLEAVRDIMKPNRHERKIPWQETVRAGHPYYPQFMQVSLATREAAQDRHTLEEKLKVLSRQNRTTPVIKLLGNLDAFPCKWDLEKLQLRIDQMNVFDFTLETGWQAVDLTQLLVENRVGKHATYRIITVDTLTGGITGKLTEKLDWKLFNVYLHFAHPDAWENIVDFYGSTPVFRGSPQGRETSAVAGGGIWNTSISFPHFCLDGPNKVQELDDFPRACISICVTGDNLGEFWTCSILGKTTWSHLDGTDIHKLDLNIDNKVGMIIPILENSKYDRYSARNLIFILHLTEICHNICERYESCLSKLVEVIDIKKSKETSRRIAIEEDLNQSIGRIKEVTDALRKALWGVEWLENFDRTLRLTETEIKIAVTYVEENLSKRRRHWNKKLEESEDIIWTRYKVSLARIMAFRNQVGSILHEASGVKDNLRFLSNMNATRATLQTTENTLQTTKNTLSAFKTALETARDSANMKVIAVLTTLFLPFTFFAVLLTTPMFKWPDPPGTQVIVKQPFIIYWVASGATALVIGVPLYFMAWRKRKDSSSETSAASAASAASATAATPVPTAPPAPGNPATP